MSFWGTLLAKLKDFWRLTRHRVVELFPRRPSVPKPQPVPAVDIEEAREHARTVWVDLVRKRAPHLLAQGRIHPMAGRTFSARLQPPPLPVAKSAQLPGQPKSVAPVPVQVLMGGTASSANRSRNISGAARQPAFPVDGSEGAPAPGPHPSAPQVLAPRRGSSASVSPIDDRRDADRHGNPGRLDIAESGSGSDGEPTTGCEAVSRNAVASEQVSEPFNASEITPSFQRDLEMPAVPESPVSDPSWGEDAAEGDEPFSTPLEEAMAERAVAPLPESPDWPGEASRPEVFDPGLGHAALEMEAWSEPFADSPRPRLPGADEASRFFVATPGETRPFGSLRQASGASDRWPSLLPDRQPETDSRLPVSWREMAYRQRLMEEQRGL